MMMLSGLVRSPHRLTRRNLLLCQIACSRQQYYSSDRGGSPSLSNPSIASVLALRPDPNGPQRTQVTVAGFVRTIRNQKQRSFVELGDGSTVYALQAVVPPSHAKGYVCIVSSFRSDAYTKKIRRTLFSPLADWKFLIFALLYPAWELGLPS